MRHLGSVLLALILAPAIWALTGIAQVNLALETNREIAVGLSDFRDPLGLLAAGGLLIGLIATLRISPLGPVLAGIGFIAAQSWWASDPVAVNDRLDGKFLGTSAALSAPMQTGVAALLGVALLTSVFSIKRWRRWPRPKSTGPTIRQPGPPPVITPPPPSLVTPAPDAAAQTAAPHTVAPSVDTATVPPPRVSTEGAPDTTWPAAKPVPAGSAVAPAPAAEPPASPGPESDPTAPPQVGHKND